MSRSPLLTAFIVLLAASVVCLADAPRPVMPGDGTGSEPGQTVLFPRESVEDAGIPEADYPQCFEEALRKAVSISSRVLRVPSEYATIQAAIDAASTGDVVLVDEGTYAENLVVKKLIILQGYGAQKTIIDGQAKGAVIEVSADAVISGFTITNGKRIEGAGIYVRGSACPTIMDSIITENEGDTGAGLGSRHGCVRILHNVVSKNKGASWGGGVFCAGDRVLIIGNLVEENTCNHGAGIDFFEGEAVIINNVVRGNKSRQDGGGIGFVRATGLIGHNIVAENSAGQVGGGVECAASSPVIRSNVVVQNAGGGLRIESSRPEIVDNLVVGNTTTRRSAGMDLWETQAVIRHNILAKNESGAAGGGIGCVWAACELTQNIITGNSAVEAGGGVHCERSELVLKHNDIWGNQADEGPADCSGCALTETDIAADPWFKDANYDAPQDGDWSLKAASPCLPRDGGRDPIGLTGPERIGLLVGTTPGPRDDLVKARVEFFETVERGRKWRVLRVPSGYLSIQEAINDADDGDVVWVEAGDYGESPHITKNIRLQGAGAVRTQIGPVTVTSPRRDVFLDRVVIDGFTITHSGTHGIASAGASPVISNNVIRAEGVRRAEQQQQDVAGISCGDGSPRILNNVITGDPGMQWRVGISYRSVRDTGRLIEIRGNVIQNGSASGYGGGVLVSGAMVSIENNIIRDNRSTLDAGGMGLWRTAGTIRNNMIIGNRAVQHGSAILMSRECELLLLNNIIAANECACAVSIDEAKASIVNNIIVSNQGGAVRLYKAPIELKWNIIARNGAVSGAGIWCRQSEPRVIENIIVENAADIEGGGIHCWASQPIIEDNDFWGNTAGVRNPDFSDCRPGDGNISEDPLFLSLDYEHPEKGDWRLGEDSPCRAAHDGKATIGLSDPSAVGLSAPDEVGPRPWPFSALAADLGKEQREGRD